MRKNTMFPLQLQTFDAMFGKMYASDFDSEANRLNERIQMAATILVISSLVLLYHFMQKYFVKGIESVGITGEQAGVTRTKKHAHRRAGVRVF